MTSPGDAGTALDPGTALDTGTALDPGTALWVRVGPAAEIPVGEGRAYSVAGEQVAVFRLRGGAFRAVSAVCPHAGGPLADGQIDDQVVVCPLHLNAFSLETGASAGTLPSLACYPVEVDDQGYLVLQLPG